MTFTATPTVFVPVTGNPLLSTQCIEVEGVITWTVQNPNTFDISFIWWIVGGSSTGGPVAVPAGATVSFDSPQEGVPTQLAIMWYDPVDGAFKTVTGSNSGEFCSDEQPTPTPTATPEPGVLIPITGIELPSIFRESIFLNLGIGVFGFALILLGIGIKLDRDEEEDEEYEFEFDDED